MKIDVLTLFPKMFDPILNESIIKHAQKKGLININVHNLRNWSTDKYGTVDDTPYGGGAGMILKVDVIDRALLDLKSQISSAKLQTNSKIQISKSISKKLKSKIPVLNLSNKLNLKTKIILLTPKGKKFNQSIARNLSSYSHLLLICGHYGGYDERIRKLVDMEISLGDFVLTGGEIPAIAIIDAVTRLVPSVINPESLENETHSKKGYKQYPQYTRPRKYKAKSKQIKKLLSVPNILISGNHAKINSWHENYSKH